MSNHGNTYFLTFGLGMASGLVGSYMMMSPRHQRDVQKNLNKAVDELSDIIEDIGSGIKGMK